MNHRHLILFCSALSLITTPATARQLSEDEAKVVAQSFIGNNVPKFTKAPVKNRDLKIVYTAERKSENAFFVIDHGEDSGFLIVSADDRLPQVLGYSSSGSFDYENAPENLKWWLSQYENEIFNFYSRDNAINTLSATTQDDTDSKAVISPLVTTKWNQDAPYNNDCPVDAGGRSVTGCAATALAQIVNYHNYPERNGMGTYSYTWNGQTLKYDYSTANFDWENMRDTYDQNSPEVANKAVANLMLACGIGLHMNYSSRVSGASDIAVPRLLVENMGYDGSVTIAQRTHYSFKDWQDLIYNELREKRPVFYTGQANSGGHAFVCDGYSGNGYFHFNWGWGGQSDGDFLLSALNPLDQGIGSYDGGYNSDQTAVINIMKDKGNGRSAILFVSSGFTFENGYFNTGSISNWSTYNINATIGIEIINENGGGQPLYLDGPDLSINGADLDTGKYSYRRCSFIVKPQGLAPGKYRCYPVYKTADTPWTPLRPPYGEQQYVLLTVGEDGSISYSNPGPEISYDLSVLSFSVSGKVYHDAESTLTITVKNNADADYNNYIRMGISKNGEAINNVNINISVAAGQSFIGSFNYKFDLNPGTYEVNFFDATGQSINKRPFNITVEEGNAPIPATGVIFKGVKSDIFYKDYGTLLTLLLYNNSNSTIAVNQFTLNTLDSKGNIINIFNVGGYTFEAGVQLNLGLNGFYIPADAGKYFLEGVKPKCRCMDFMRKC